MRILYITNNYPTSNFPIFGIFVKEQIESVIALGVESEVFFINSRENGESEYFKSIFRLRKYMRGKKYDIIHCHHSLSALTLLCSGKIFGKRCILSYQSDPKNEGGLFLFRILYLFFDRIILKNDSPQTRYSKVVYLPNGVNTDFFVPKEKDASKIALGLDIWKRYILFMDSYNIRPFKRIDRFNEILRILKEKYQLKDVEPLVLTNVKRSLIPDYLAASSLHLLTSDFEGSPNSVKECIACNVPVVSTPVGNVEFLIGDIDGCYVSGTFDPEELALLSDKALKSENYSSREFIGKKGLDLGTVAERLIGVYREMLK
jgi:glycosyltransferase involved in cell wall biosynthesis